MVRKVMKVLPALLAAAIMCSPALAPVEAADAGGLAGIAILPGMMNDRNKHYYKYENPAGAMEKKYTPPGPEKVSRASYKAEGTAWKKYEVWYPKSLKEGNKTCPMVIMANGTGTKAFAYGEVFNHPATWGFIAVGNEDDNSRTGASSSHAGLYAEAE